MAITAHQDITIRNDTLSVRISLVDDGPHGIGLVEVLDYRGARVSNGRMDFSLDDVSGEPCPSHAELTVEILASQYPLVVEAEDCNEDEPRIWETTLDPGPPGADFSPSPSLPCPDRRLFDLCHENTECEQAQSEVNTTRTEIMAECREVTRLRRERDEWGAATKAMLDVAAGFAAAAAGLKGIPIIGTALAVIAAVIAAILFVLATVFGVLAAIAQGDLDSAEARLVDARSRFTDAATTVNRSCCPGCTFVDTDLPEC